MSDQVEEPMESEWVHPSVTFYTSSEDPEIQAIEIGLRMTERLDTLTRERVLRYLLERASADAMARETRRVRV